MQTPEQSPERDAAIEALLPNVPFDGWTYRALRTGLGTAGRAADAELLFPGGAVDMIEAYCDLADRKMGEGAAGLGLDTMRLSERVRAVLALRLRQNRAHKEAVRRALGILALPRNARRAAASTARTVDAIWRLVGDRAVNFSWYTKRVTLASIYTATVLFWIADQSEEDEATMDFLDRRLGDLGRITRLRRRAGALIRPPA